MVINTVTRHRMIKIATLLSSLILFCDFRFVPTCLGQGTVNFSNLNAPGGITNGLTGQLAEVGSTFNVALYFAQDGIVDEAQFIQAGGATPIRLSPGYFNAGVLTAPTDLPGGYGMFQVRAWETSFGMTYEQAVANSLPQDGRLALVGQSGIMRVDTGDPTLPVPTPPGSLLLAATVAGMPLSEGFTLTVVPEPTSLMLLLLTLPVCLLCRRRRQ
jgi:hypothetical protein